MAFDAFLKVGDINGESTDAKHKDWIEVLSYHHGLSQPASPLQGGGEPGAERASFEDFFISKPLDQASPKLVLACAAGQHIQSVVLELWHKKQGQPFMKYTLSDCIVSSVHTAGVAASDERPIDEVSFNFAQIEWRYTKLNPNGSSAGEVVTAWDRAGNK